MSAAAAANAPGAGKKAVHVKWAGKTIALGTFPASEADEKCAKAKALTRAWRSSMRPKPSREWVMLELERLGVRVVSGRLGRKAGEEGDDGSAGAPDKKGMGASPNQGQMNPGMAGVGGGMPRNNSMGWGSDADLTNLIASRRNSSLGLSMMNDTMGRRGSLSSLGQIIGLDDAAMPPHRPFVGGGAAAAFEAARHDHFTQKSAEQQRRASSLGLGSLGGGGMSGMGMSVNPNQHYEMLKLHHMNLLNEIQETTLMMNLYQQQQLQQQQQQLQQQAAADQLGGGGGADAQLSMLMQQQSGGGMNGDPLFGASQLHQRASLGLGGPQFGGSAGGNFNNSGSGSGSMNNGMRGGGSEEMQSRMNAMQNDMSGSGAKKDSKEGGSSPKKRSAGEEEGGDTKRAKTADT
mmetsp:Transcript_7753/g.15542  ORF Transcript_7753/g.15542 Transcript_7753/m.15542 type:complete len:405 (-) Transcript_7753:70-1284(-)